MEDTVEETHLAEALLGGSEQREQKCGATRYAGLADSSAVFSGGGADALTGMRRSLSQVRRLKVMRPAAETPPAGGGGSCPVTPSLINNALTTSGDGRCTR